MHVRRSLLSSFIFLGIGSVSHAAPVGFCAVDFLTDCVALSDSANPNSIDFVFDDAPSGDDTDQRKDPDLFGYDVLANGVVNIRPASNDLQAIGAMTATALAAVPLPSGGMLLVSGIGICLFTKRRWSPFKAVAR